MTQFDLISPSLLVLISLGVLRACCRFCSGSAMLTVPSCTKFLPRDAMLSQYMLPSYMLLCCLSLRRSVRPTQTGWGWNPHGRGNFGDFRPTEHYWEFLLRCMQWRHTAPLLQSTSMLPTGWSHIILSMWKIYPHDAAFREILWVLVIIIIIIIIGGAYVDDDKNNVNYLPRIRHFGSEQNVRLYRTSKQLDRELSTKMSRDHAVSKWTLSLVTAVN